MTPCPCGSGQTLETCCGPIIAGAPAPSPEALMRSRYTAYLQRAFDHVERTHTPEANADFDRAEAERVANEVEWLGLEIHRAEEDGDTGVVEFTVRFRHNGVERRNHEVSQFRRQAGAWLYVDGQVSSKGTPRQVVKVGRNDPCPCGSGKKYKKCCGA